MSKRFRRPSLPISITCLLVALLTHIGDATAQNSSSDLSTVTVTALVEHYRGDVKLRELPQSSQVIPATLLSDTAVTTLADALDLVSSVSRQNDFGGLWDAFAVRGFAGDENVPSGYLVNGFNEGRGFDGPRDMSGVERIEVLEGPSSALFGRGEPGGTVNIITKQPEFTPEGSFGASVGSYQDYRMEGDSTGPIDDWIAYRINGAYEQANSFRNDVNSSKFTVTPSFVAKFSPATTLSYQLELTRQSAVFDRGIIGLNDKLGIIPISEFLGEPGNPPITVNVFGNQLELQHKLNSAWTVLLGFGYRTTGLKGYSEDPELAVSRQLLYVDGQDLSRERRYRDYQTKDMIPRGEISGRFNTGSLVHHLLFGTDYDDFNFNSLQARYRPPPVTPTTTLLEANALDIFAPVYGNLPPIATFQSSLEHDKEWGAYAHDQIDLLSDLKIRFGARYDIYKQSIRDNLAGATTYQNVDRISPEAGIVYDVTSTLWLYANYGGGFRPNTGSNFYGVPFQPEITKSYEAGLKFQTPSRLLTGTLAFYRMTKSNVLTADPVNSGFSLALGGAESKGVQLDMTGQLPWWALRVWLSYSRIHAFVSNTELDPDFGRLVSAGDPLINIPRDDLSVLLMRDFQVRSSVLSVGSGFNYVGQRLGETGTSFELPAYRLVKVFASYSVTQDFDVRVVIDNLLNETYYPSSYAQLWVMPGEPREFNVSANYHF